MDGGFPVLFRADYLQAGSTDSQNPLMHLGRRHNLAQADRHVAMDPFDQWWKCARKPVDRRLTIPTVIHNAVTAFQADDRRDHLKVNDARTRAPRPQCFYGKTFLFQILAHGLQWHSAQPRPLSKK
jgi:hypothetical protein